MKSFKQFINEEDGGVATNNVSGGNIAGLGVGPQGEPPGIPAGFAGMFRRSLPGRKRAYVSDKNDAVAGTKQIKTFQRRSMKKKPTKEDQRQGIIPPTMPFSTPTLAK